MSRIYRKTGNTSVLPAALVAAPVAARVAALVAFVAALVIIAAALVAFTAAGCGSSGGRSDDDAAVQSDAAADGGTEPDGQVPDDGGAEDDGGTQPPEGLQVSQDGHYLEFRGRRVILAGDSVTQGWQELGADFDQTGYVDALAARGINVLMLALEFLTAH